MSADETNRVNSLFPVKTRHFLINSRNTYAPFEESLSVTLKKEGTEAGNVSLTSGLIHGTVEFDVSLEGEYAKDGYYAEIYAAMSDFFFRFREVEEIICFSGYEDDHRIRGLERAGYVRRETKDDSCRYSVTRQKTGWTGLYLVIGLIAGMIMGIVFSNLWVGTAIGVVTGALIGLILDRRK